MTSRRPTRAAAVGFILAATLAACSIHVMTRDAVTRAPTSANRSVCVLIFDGLPASTFQRLVDTGSLPNLKRAVVDRALRVENAVASIPTETYPNISALQTGLFPGHHGLPANIWLDRRVRQREAHTNIFRSYSASDFFVPEARTVFERLPAGTVAVTTPVARGATVVQKNVVAIAASYLRNDWAFLDRKTIDDVGDAYAGAWARGRLPPLVWAHLLGPDEVQHFDGVDSPALDQTLRSFDRAFGRLLRRLEKRGIADRILYAVVSDHGHTPYANVVDVTELVHRALFAHPTETDCAGAKCVLRPVPGVKEKTYDVGEAEIAVGAYRGAMIWLPSVRPPEDVPRALRSKKRSASRLVRAAAPPSAEPSAFAAALARAPEVGLVATRGPAGGRVVLYGPRGRAEIVRSAEPGEAPLYAYRVLEGEDPLGYMSIDAIRPLVASPHRAETWLAATAGSAFPDLPVQLAEFFDSPRSPDVYISPANGWGFTPARVGGHGSLSRGDLVVPMLFAGPGVVPGRIGAARTVDLAPTLLGYLGVPFVAEELDGEDLGIGRRRGLPAPAPVIPAAGPAPR